MNEIEYLLNKIGDSYEYFTPSTYREELLMDRVDREFSYVSHELSVSSRRRKGMPDWLMMTASKVIEDFLMAMEGMYDMEDNRMAFSEFVNESITVIFISRPDVRLHISFEEGIDEGDHCLLVYRENDEEVMTNDSIINTVGMLKQILIK